MRRTRRAAPRLGRLGLGCIALALLALLACEEGGDGAAPAEAPAGGAAMEGAPASPSTDPEPTDRRFVVETRVESYETFVDIRPRGRAGPGWHLRLKAASLRPTWDGERLRGVQAKVLGAMLERLRADYGDVVERASVHVNLSAWAYPEYVERLARHAAGDPAWRALRVERREVGAPRVGALHRYIVDATREHGFHGELDRSFATIGLRLRLEGVEKCGSARPGDSSELGRWLQDRAIRSRVAVPTGCLMAWFDLEPRPP